ncbi:NADP-dependent oxidoreductase domain-containing protein [Geopyxis carbonaria]|nr:NADP-dependent oxidoreductase domain-containing protein [Geopyxis carbonaria]
MSLIPSFKLSTGAVIPALAYGSGTAWYKKPGQSFNPELVAATKRVLDLGYHHLDCAEIYQTEEEIGAGIKEWGGDRSKLFITTKISPAGVKDPEASLNASLKKLGVDYVDLWLLHCPFFTQESHGSTVERVWKTMEELHASGRARAIGVSNFNLPRLQALLAYAKVAPACNQIELNPYCIDRQLNEFCKTKGILLEAYSPLAPIIKTPGTPVDTAAIEIAEKHGVSKEQVLLKWCIQKGFVAVCTTSNEGRMKAFLELGFELTGEEVERIEKEGQKEHHRYYWKKEYGEK